MLYDVIKQLCKEKNISVTSVERNAGLGTGTISKWNKSSPKVDSLKAVATVLHVKVSKLLEE